MILIEEYLYLNTENKSTQNINIAHISQEKLLGFLSHEFNKIYIYATKYDENIYDIYINLIYD
jgi:hypothetical protein